MYIIKICMFIKSLLKHYIYTISDRSEYTPHIFVNIFLYLFFYLTFSHQGCIKLIRTTRKDVYKCIMLQNNLF